MSWPRVALALACATVLPLCAAEPLVIAGATIHTLGPAGTIERGTLVVDGGRILAVGPAVAIPEGARVIDASGRVVTPGLVDAYGTLGIEEIDLEPSTDDRGAIASRYSAAFAAADSINPRAVRIEINRVEGITQALVAPVPLPDALGLGPVIAGQAALISLDTEADYLLRRRAGIVFVFGEAGAALSGGSRSVALLRLREALDDAQDYAANRAEWLRRQRRDYALSALDLEALEPLLAGEVPLFAEAHRASDILSLIEVAREYGLDLVIAGGSEAWLVARELHAARVPVILDVEQNLPSRFEALAATLENAARLHAASVQIAFATGDRTNPRNVRQLAGNAVAHGLPYEAALAAITRNPAEIFGLAADTGSLAAGRLADLVIWDGDPLEVTSFAERVFIRGRPIEMRSRATDLRDRYRPNADPWPPQYNTPR